MELISILIFHVRFFPFVNVALISLLMYGALHLLKPIVPNTTAASGFRPVGLPRQVRGAPLIAIVAVLGLSVEAVAGSWGEGTAEDASKMIHDK